MNTFKKTVMDRCQQEGLHQIDLLAPDERKITRKEYMAQKHGQQKLDEINQKIIEDGLKPTSTVFLTQKEYLRNAFFCNLIYSFSVFSISSIVCHPSTAHFTLAGIWEMSFSTEASSS